jgi:CBS domain-containing protein
MRQTDFLAAKKEFHGTKAEMLMERNILSCKPTQTARYAASRLTAYDVGSLPVVDEEGFLVGLVSEFDLLKVLLSGRELADRQVREVMTPEVKFVRPDTPVDEIIRLMEQEHLIRVPVVEDGKLIGIVARRDVLYGYLKTTAGYWH